MPLPAMINDGDTSWGKAQTAVKVVSRESFIMKFRTAFLVKQMEGESLIISNSNNKAARVRE